VTATTDPRLETATAMREAGQDEEARRLLLELHADQPKNALVNLQCAWVHDKLGLESEAVSFYEKALGLGLEGDDLRDALLGLGSTYRAIGQYEKAVSTLRRGVDLFPGHGGIKVFLALALYNDRSAKEACEMLLQIVADTSADPTVAAYRRALDLYAEDLDRIW
jgi:tetratricopeptide (TPR) repeat protein